MAHCVIPDADAILDQPFPVLDKGFVRLVDYLGGDQRIVQSARVSYGSGTKTYREDKGLINYLLRNDHTSPFEQVIFTFHVKLPIFVARQWIRHRTARVNEISGRYSVMQPEFYVPNIKDIAYQSTDNKQGRSKDSVDEETSKTIQFQIELDQKIVYKSYENMINLNIAKELSRINLPLSLYTEWYWQIDLHNLFKFLKLRLDSHAQIEIRAYAEVLKNIGSKVCPIAFDAFNEHVQYSITLSKTEVSLLKASLENSNSTIDEKLKSKLFS